jgi:hypothetical protein
MRSAQHEHAGAAADTYTVLRCTVHLLVISISSQEHTHTPLYSPNALHLSNEGCILISYCTALGLLRLSLHSSSSSGSRP